MTSSTGCQTTRAGAPALALVMARPLQTTEARPEGGGRPAGGEPDGAAERAWVERARAGEREAFDLLVRRHFARVYAVAHRMVGNHEDAEDLAQETFVRAWRSLGYLRGDGRFLSWLLRIALHLARDRSRAAGRGPRTSSLDAPGGIERAAGPGPDERLAGRELRRAIRAALDALGHRRRAALVLRVFEEMPYAEIARVLDVAPITARIHVMKARRALARSLAPWLGGGAP